MSVPTYDHFIGPVLRYLVRQPNGARLAVCLALVLEEGTEWLAGELQQIERHAVGGAMIFVSCNVL